MAESYDGAQAGAAARESLRLTAPDLFSVIAEAEDQLRVLNRSPFSPQAFAALEKRIARFIGDLISESVREAKRQQLDTVSETHVERAGEFLAANGGHKIFRHLGTLGGILLGAAVSNLLALAGSTAVTFPSVALTTGLAVLGAFAIALHMARD